MTPEQAFYQKLRQYLVPQCHVQRFEAAAAGIPDMLVCHNGLETWTELKCCVRGIPLLRKEQYAWGMAHASHGGRVLVVAEYLNSVHVWKYPDIQISLSGAYLAITNDPIAKLSYSSILSVYLH